MMQIEARQICEIGAQNLCSAIVTQAIKDYRRAGRERRDSLERFFRSEWFGMLTQIDPEQLIFNLRRRFRG